MARNIIIVVLAVAVIIFAVLFILGRVSAGADAKRIIDLEDTVDRVGKNNRELEKANSDALETIAGLRGSLGAARKTIDGIESTLGDAGAGVQDALDSVGRLEKLALKIEN